MKGQVKQTCFKKYGNKYSLAKKSFEDFSLFIFKGLLRKPLPKCIYNLKKPQCFKCAKPNVKITNKLNF